MIRSKGSATYGSEKLNFSIAYCKRKTLAIAVYPDQRVAVTAPQGTTYQKICAKVIKRGRWIKKQLDYFQQFTPKTPPRKYISGENHHYLGKPFRLKTASGAVNDINMLRGQISISVKGRVTPVKTKKILERWLLQQARKKFAEIFEQYWPAFKKRNQPKPTLQIRKMKTRWGSLSPNGLLTLNLRLIQTPQECIEYVILHELCHLVYRDHSENFYRLLLQHMPDWERRKHRLEISLF